MKTIVLKGLGVGLLLLVVGCDLIEPKTEAEKFLDKLTGAINDVADVLARVQNSATAHAAIDDINRTLPALREVLSQLPSAAIKYKDVKVSKAREERIVKNMEKAAERLKTECERIERMSDLPPDFVECLVNQFTSLAGVGEGGMNSVMARHRMSTFMHMRSPRSTGFGPSMPTPPAAPPTPPETPAQRQERERQQQEAERRAKEQNDRWQKEQEEARRREEERRKEEMGPDPSDPRYYEKLVERMSSDDSSKRDRAMAALLKKTPDDVPSPETRKQIAKAFKRLAEDSSMMGREKENAIKGLVIWGGRFSGPILLKMLTTSDGFEQKHLIQALGEIKYAPAAAAIADRLDDMFCHERAIAALREIGPEAEDAVIRVAISEKPRVCLAAVDLLSEFGTAKCLPLLVKGLSSRNMQVREACREAIRRVKTRIKEAKEKGEAEEV